MMGVSALLGVRYRYPFGGGEVGGSWANPGAGRVGVKARPDPLDQGVWPPIRADRAAGDGSVGRWRVSLTTTVSSVPRRIQEVGRYACAYNGSAAVLLMSGGCADESQAVTLWRGRARSW